MFLGVAIIFIVTIIFWFIFMLNNSVISNIEMNMDNISLMVGTVQKFTIRDLEKKEHMDNLITELELVMNIIEEEHKKIEEAKNKTKDIILNVKKISSNKHKDGCAICLNNKSNEQYLKLMCNHYFHLNCLSHWIDKKNKCPICRAGLDLKFV